MGSNKGNDYEMVTASIKAAEKLLRNIESKPRFNRRKKKYCIRDVKEAVKILHESKDRLSQ